MKTELLKEQNSVENVGKVNSGTTQQREELLNTPFDLVYENGNENGFIVFGNYKITEAKFKDQKEAHKDIKQ